MRAEAPSPWPFLLSRLRSARKAVVCRDEIVAAGLDPEGLLRAHLIERQGGARWRPPGCERDCFPNLDIESRYDENLVGIACPHDPPCWPGWQWIAFDVLEVFTCPAERVFRALQETNGLQPIDAELDGITVPVGILARRDRRIPVVWMLSPPLMFREICNGLRTTLGGDGLVVLLSRSSAWQAGTRFPGDIIVLDVRDDVDGDLALWRALDVLDPDYRRDRVSDPTAIFDDISFELATVPGERHVVRINGHDLDGFRRSDLKFTRLLYLAAFRAADLDIDGGGWMEKWRLQGDDKDHDVEALRKELGKSSHPDFGPEELRSLIKSSPARDGRIRLAVHPRRIRFDASLASLKLVGEQQTKSRRGEKRRTPGAERLAANLRQGALIAEQILAAARKLGVPSSS
jgi:hypothetical protein